MNLICLTRGRIPNPNPNSSSLPDHDDQTATTMAATATGLVVDGPPIDDCCPICFGDFVAPCRALCGHWYCGGCILEYWSHVASFRPCKCPMCSQQITKLIPEPSLYHQQEDVEVGAVLKNVQQYNRLFVGGIFGFLLKMLQFPLFMKKVLQAMMEMDLERGALDNAERAFAGRLCWFAVFLMCLYMFLPSDILPIAPYKVLLFLCYSSIAMACILILDSLYIIVRHIQNVRRLADVI